MSRRKDRERFQAMMRLDPDYKGYRGWHREPARGNVPLEPVVCTRCGRKRNVPRGIALEQGEHYVCGICRESPEESPP